MKALLLSIGMLFLVDPCSAQAPRIQLEYFHLDRGEILFNGDGIFRFPFTNIGEDTLIISSVKSSCGCLVPTYNRQPIAPGATDTIYGKYDTKRLGPIHKSMTITSNDPHEPRQLIRIRGIVREHPIPVRFFSTDSLPKGYHRSFHTPHQGKEIYVYLKDSQQQLSYRISESDSIMIAMENSSADMLTVNMAHLTSLKMVKWQETASPIQLSPNESILLHFVVVHRSKDTEEQLIENAILLIHDEPYELIFSEPYRFKR